MTPVELRLVARTAVKLADARVERDNAVRDAYERGYSLREIADAAGLSHAGVKKIIERA